MMVNGLKSKFKATNMGRAFVLNLQKNQKSKRAETKKQTKNSIPSFTKHTTRRRVVAHSVDLLHRGDVLLLQSGHFIVVVVVVIPRGLRHIVVVVVVVIVVVEDGESELNEFVDS